MKIESFEDILRVDSELAKLFLRQDEAVRWIYNVENHIKDWVCKHNKQYWEVVRYVSEKRGILGVQSKDETIVKLKRSDFASVLLKFCPNALKENETKNALKSSMEHYKYISDLCFLNGKNNNANDKKSKHHTIVLSHIKEVEDLLDNKPIIKKQESVKAPSLIDIVEQYLRREVDEHTNSFPKSRLCIRQQYNDITPEISIETYKSDKFLKDNKPSYIDAYEFIDGVLERNKLDELTGKYQEKYQEITIKLYIVSSKSLRPDIKSLLIKRNIGYVLLNPKNIMTSDDYVLPRSIEDKSKQFHNLEVLEGNRRMSTPILILSARGLTSSLADTLNYDGVIVKKRRLLNIPFLSEEEIENRANSLTENDVENIIRILKSTDITTKIPSLNPFAYADLLSLSYKIEEMNDESQLGLLDVNKNLVLLNSDGSKIHERFRFTMAHELGHYVLHLPLFKEQGVISVGESENTISISESDSRRLEYQANKFASSLLMPRKLVYKLYEKYYCVFIQQKYGGELRPLYYNFKQPETRVSYRVVVGNMAKQMEVSLQAIDLRLKSLGLLKTPN